MRFGLTLNPQAPADASATALADSLITQTQMAEEFDYDYVKISQHYLSDYNQLQVIPMLGRVAAECRSIGIASGLIVLPLHHPIMIAEQVATLTTLVDEVYVGVGAGYRDIEFENFGIPKSERVARLVEGVQIMNLLWTEESVDYDGKVYSLRDATINPRPESKPPIWIGANAEKAVKRAAKLADAWLIPMHNTIAEIKEQKCEYDEIRRERGMDTAVPLSRETFVAPTTEEAVAVGRTYLASKYEQYVRWGQHEAMDDETELKQAFDRLAEDRFLLGTPEEICAELDRYQEELEISDFIIRLHWPGLPYEEAYDCIELFGDEVIPYV